MFSWVLDKDVFTVQEAARLLKVHPESLLRAIRTGRLKATKSETDRRMYLLTGPALAEAINAGRVYGKSRAREGVAVCSECGEFMLGLFVNDFRIDSRKCERCRLREYSEERECWNCGATVTVYRIGNGYVWDIHDCDFS